jgi:hypothetical protein
MTMRAVMAAMVILVRMGAIAHAEGPISKQCKATADAQSKKASEDLIKQFNGCKSGDLMLASLYNVDPSVTDVDGAGMLQQVTAASLCDYHSTILATKDGPLAFVTCIKR